MEEISFPECFLYGRNLFQSVVYMRAHTHMHSETKDQILNHKTGFDRLVYTVDSTYTQQF